MLPGPEAHGQVMPSLELFFTFQPLPIHMLPGPEAYGQEENGNAVFRAIFYLSKTPNT